MKIYDDTWSNEALNDLLQGCLKSVVYLESHGFNTSASYFKAQAVEIERELNSRARDSTSPQ